MSETQPIPPLNRPVQDREAERWLLARDLAILIRRRLRMRERRPGVSAQPPQAATRKAETESRKTYGQ